MPTIPIFPDRTDSAVPAYAAVVAGHDIPSVRCTSYTDMSHQPLRGPAEAARLLHSSSLAATDVPQYLTEVAEEALMLWETPVRAAAEFMSGTWPGRVGHMRTGFSLSFANHTSMRWEGKKRVSFQGGLD